jgi:hypothetical protein
MKRGLLCKLCMTGMAMGFLFTANAKTWRVNSNISINANFVQLADAVAHASVLAGDTLYVEGSTIQYASFELKKRLVIIGPGFLLSGASGGNDGLQFNTAVSYLATMYIDSLASGSVIMGMSGFINLDSKADNITISRCNIIFSVYNSVAGAKASDIRLTKNYLAINNSPAFDNLECTNNIIVNFCSINNPDNNNLLFRNNVITTSANITNAYISNNIFIAGLNPINSTVKYNFSTSNTLPAGNNNINNVSFTQLFINTGSSDGLYRLAAASPAIGAGEPINGITPDCGAFGTSDPYRLSGIPPIPTIYALTVPASVPSSATSMTVTVSTRSNN